MRVNSELYNGTGNTKKLSCNDWTSINETEACLKKERI